MAELSPFIVSQRPRIEHNALRANVLLSAALSAGVMAVEVSRGSEGEKALICSVGALVSIYTLFKMLERPVVNQRLAVLQERLDRGR